MAAPHELAAILRDAAKWPLLRACECFDFRRLQWLAERDSIDVLAASVG
jgi:hypothetical protein